jgi:hypothetical protein
MESPRYKEYQWNRVNPAGEALRQDQPVFPWHEVTKMAIISRPDVPFIPENITVHLGAPDEPARNVTVSFPNYIKNVASSELYPTWPESALRANFWLRSACP